MAELDAIRAGAAIAVIFYHASARTGLPPLDLAIKMGWLSVDLFFLLSGFLITSIILAHRVDRTFLGAFYARRALRIWPIYYLAIVALAMLSRAGMMPSTWPPLTPRLLLHYATFTQAIPSYWGDHSAYYHPIGHFWSLAVEEQFYLIWPFLILLFGRTGVIPISLIFIASGLLSRDWVDFESRHVLLARCDGLAYGAILAVVVTRPHFAAHRRAYAAGFAAIALAGVAGLGAWTLLVSRKLFWSTSVLIFVDPIFFGLVGLIVAESGRAWLAPLRLRGLDYIGKISYGLYLYHFLIFTIIDHTLGDGTEGDRFLAVKIGLTALVAVISWEFFEKPILSLKDRFPYAIPGPTPKAG